MYKHMSWSKKFSVRLPLYYNLIVSCCFGIAEFPKYFWSDYLFKSISRHDIEGVYIYYIILRGINDSAESDST